ncbi:predicted protein [Histoplasma mississippiense (nom. inval.)]|uniref:predicted protein n=1 Tax=Ajellomyces capsulatus (strain NAm1 / WU24) TaxID=2059318 RepID=UPI000157C567|nr:predicted protein [Histoplasma mississippiense (nom. inval.)]EDN08263.1 predicted protein [Histoplasma mississippiense (nom. inval.)]
MPRRAGNQGTPLFIIANPEWTCGRLAGSMVVNFSTHCTIHNHGSPSAAWIPGKSSVARLARRSFAEHYRSLSNPRPVLEPQENNRVRIQQENLVQNPSDKLVIPNPAWIISSLTLDQEDSYWTHGFIRTLLALSAPKIISRNKPQSRLARNQLVKVKVH